MSRSWRSQCPQCTREVVSNAVKEHTQSAKNLLENEKSSHSVTKLMQVEQMQVEQMQVEQMQVEQMQVEQ
jgi:hypothetical protein